MSPENPKESFVSLEIDHVLEAVERAGLAPTGHCLTLNSFENRVYDLKLENGNHAVVKFYRPGRWSREQILEEHEFLFDLQAEEVPVCVPIALKDGSTVGTGHGLYFAVWPRTGGRSPDELSPDDAALLGRFLGRLHNIGSAKSARHRIRLDSKHYIHEPLGHLLATGVIPDRLRGRYESAAGRIAELYDDLSSGVPFHRIHGDCHKGNLIRGDGGFFFLDFDDFLTGPAVQDIWMLIPERDEYGLLLRETMIEAYRQFRDFDSSWFRLVEALRGMRYVHYAAWISRRWDDPLFPASFPHFGTVDYWEKETNDLEGQVAMLSEGDGTDDSSEDSEPELTNRDFFWDLE